MLRYVLTLWKDCWVQLVYSGELFWSKRQKEKKNYITLAVTFLPYLILKVANMKKIVQKKLAIIHVWSRQKKNPPFQYFSLFIGKNCEDIKTRSDSRGWYVLVGPGWRKPFKCILGLLWYDVIRWRMDDVLHHRWICETQNRSHVQL